MSLESYDLSKVSTRTPVGFDTITDDRLETPPKILYFVGVDWFFHSHFLDRALAAKQAGYRVVVLTQSTSAHNPFAEHGIDLIDISFQRRSLNPIGLIRNLLDIRRVLKRERPDIVHQIALKPIVLGSLVCKMVGIRRVVNAVVGLGYAFSSNQVSARVVRSILSIILRFVLDRKNAVTVFENADDRAYFLNKGWTTAKAAVLIRGAGVDTEHFKPSNKATEPPIVMLLSRMLWDKGIAEFVEAARHLQQKHGSQYARFVLVGDSDDDNRGAIPRDQLSAWKSEGVINWWGFQRDVRSVLAQATISCLPSYREGLPKSLLESLAMGLPCIATDVPGCREAVKDGINGYLVNAKDPVSLANAIERLLQDSSLRAQFGRASRAMAVDEFSNRIVNHQTLEVYAKIMRETD